MFVKSKNFSKEEHVLIDLCISIDLIISFSSFEVIVLPLGVKLLTFYTPYLGSKTLSRSECNRIL